MNTKTFQAIINPQAMEKGYQAIKMELTLDELEMAVDLAYLRMLDEGTQEAMQDHFVALATLERARTEIIDSHAGLYLVPTNDRRK